VFISFFFNYPFCLMGEISYVSFLGEGHEVLDSQELHKNHPWSVGGVHSLSHSHSHSFLFFCWSPHSFTHSFIHSHIHSLLFVHTLSWRFHSIHFFHPLIFPHSCLGLGKEDKLLKRNHGIVGCRDCWCNPTMI
jgi:hypothetical protein